MNSDRLKAELKEQLQEKVSIRSYVTTGLGGKADYFVECQTIDSLIFATHVARTAGIPYIVIGQGSNVLFSDSGFAGLLIVNRTNNISFMLDKSQAIVDSGVLLSRLIMEVATRDLTGLEFLFGLRGSVGGALVSNRQANGVAFSNVVKGATLLMPDEEIVHQKNNWFHFRPFSSRMTRERVLQSNVIMPVILTVSLQLSRNKKEEILRKIQHFGTLNRHSWPLEEASLGPIFRDPSPDQLAEAFLQEVKLKKTRIGRARIFSRNPNFILTNERGLGSGKSSDVYELIAHMKERVFEMYQYKLSEAFEYLGPWTAIEDKELIEYE